MVGVCAGQKLAAKGITLPAPKAGERSQLDEATKKELFASLKACKEEFRAARKGKRGGDKEEKKEDEQEQG